MNRPQIRIARQDDLVPLLELYRHLNPEDSPSHADAFRKSWDTIQERDDLFRVYVADIGGALAASCFLALVPNLSRGGRSIGLIENVVTVPEQRNRGYATMVLREAIACAWERECYKVMLMSGIKRTGAHRLYEKLGFTRNTKFAYEIRKTDDRAPLEN